jgi:hypothetical protein
MIVESNRIPNRIISEKIDDCNGIKKSVTHQMSVDYQSPSLEEPLALNTKPVINAGRGRRNSLSKLSVNTLF